VLLESKEIIAGKYQSCSWQLGRRIPWPPLQFYSRFSTPLLPSFPCLSALLHSPLFLTPPCLPILRYADPNVIIAVAGSKADLPHEGFDLAAAEDQCEQLGVPFHLTSAETGEVKGGCRGSGSIMHCFRHQTDIRASKNTRGRCTVYGDSGNYFYRASHTYREKRDRDSGVFFALVTIESFGFTPA